MTLFDAALDEVLADTGGRVRATDPDTSHEAARKVNTRGQKADVLLALVDAGERGATADELYPHTRCAFPYVVATRLLDLAKVGAAEITGRTRTTSTGRQARVWAATPLGRERAAQIRCEVSR